MTDAKNNSRFGLIFIERTGREKFKHITVRKYSDFNASRRARVITNYTLYETVGMKDTVVEIMLFISRGLFFIALAAAVVGIFLLAFKFKKRAFAIVLTLTTLVGAYFGIFGTVRNNANIKTGSEREFFDTVIADDATEYKTETDLIIANVSVCKGKNNIESAIADITSSKYQYYTVDGLDCYIGAVKCGNLDYHSLSIRGSNPVALKALFSVSSGVFLLAIQKYWRVEETPDYLKTKAFRVLRSFKMSYFCRYKEKNEAMLSPCEAF